MDEMNVYRQLEEIDQLVEMIPFTPSPDTQGKQFLFVTFHQVITGFDVRAHSLESVIEKVTRGDSDIGNITVGVDYAEITTDNTKESRAKVGDFLSAKLYRPNIPYPVIDTNTPSSLFTWKTTVDIPAVFNTLFPPPNQLDRPCYDVVFILYQFAKHNDLLGLYGSALVKQIAKCLGQIGDFEWIIYDKLLGLSNALNSKNKTRH